MVGGVPPVAGRGRRETSVMPTGAAPRGDVGPGAVDMRRIVGVMVSYTWRPEGEIFSVREGKNYIGADRIADDPSHRPCDIQVPDDIRMSGQHAVILCRQGGYELIDLMSSGGTELDGKKLAANESNELPGQAEIKAASTVFTFMAVPQSPHETPSPRREAETPPKEEVKNYTRPR